MGEVGQQALAEVLRLGLRVHALELALRTAVDALATATGTHGEACDRGEGCAIRRQCRKAIAQAVEVLEGPTS